MKFYMAPGSCSTGIHILLEEIGLVFEAYIVNLPKGEHLTPEYLAINPNGTIPTLLRDDGVALTELRLHRDMAGQRLPSPEIIAFGRKRG